MERFDLVVFRNMNESEERERLCDAAGKEGEKVGSRAKMHVS